MTRLVAVSDIAAGLGGRAASLAAELLPLGRRVGAEWIDAHRDAGGLGDSMRVHLVGAKAGVWSHFAAGVSGDALDLVAYVLFRRDRAKAVAWAKTWLGFDKGARAPMQAAAAPPPVATARAANPDAEGLRKRRMALALWSAGEPAKLDSPAARYLAGRGIDLKRLGRLPSALRTHPNLYSTEAGRDFPAMLAAISAPDGKFAAVHRTWLDVRRDGSVAKAALADPKRTLGTYAGGAIRLWRGLAHDGRPGEPLNRLPPAGPERDANNTVTIAEGIETAMSIALACPARRVLAAVSLPNLARLALPPEMVNVIIAADNDVHDEARYLVDRAVRTLQRQGRSVWIARSPVGKDFNDLLRA